MEKQLFDWKSWDDIDGMTLQFYDCTLKQKIGDFDVGTEIRTIVVDFERGLLDLYDNTQSLGTFHLLLSVGKKL